MSCLIRYKNSFHKISNNTLFM